MDASNDVDFDAFWEEESRNKTRNRIRVGRQYQASVPALLKPGESDNRRLEDLETLRWRPESLSDQTIQEYLSMAKAVSVFSRTLEHRSHENLQSAIRGLTEFVMSHHPCHRDAGCRMSVKANWTNREAELLACAIDRCENANRKKLAEPEDETGSECEDGAEGEDGADDDDAVLGDGDGAATSDNDHDGSAGSAAGTGCTDPDVDTPVDENPPSEIKPIPARIIGRKSDNQQHLLLGGGATNTESSALISTSGGLGTAGNDGGGNGRGGREGAAQTSHGGGGAAGTGGAGGGAAPGQGSLKFYLGGQLILKLNHQAHQERKSWVEAPDNPAQVTSPAAGGANTGSGSGGGVSSVGGGGSSSGKRRGGRKAQRASTTSTGIAWPERGSPSQESSSSIDSHNSAPSHGPPTPGSTTTSTAAVPTTNSGSTATNNNGGSNSSSVSSASSNNTSGGQSSSTAQQHSQPIPLDLSSQQS
ncbi:uncharacterized transmembrane protein DDB_G0289901-like [Varroa jacobsoni]|uniref:ELM2 domain-containing protein n=1 Tax=Varroa destructor TaxID=109461 RepID=A0A7M7MDL2_VARDE|nr:uncharacterized transmembrane protein DDB_G0289901-like [Varroa destructor]XP_022691453.1 uncharacterized transmembrane protein DDB_G0289901-like [Varroa jacobsoni]